MYTSVKWVYLATFKEVVRPVENYLTFGYLTSSVGASWMERVCDFEMARELQIYIVARGSNEGRCEQVESVDSDIYEPVRMVVFENDELVLRYDA